MQVVFLKDAPGVAKRFDVKQVADGYAKNFLFPKGIAKPVTPHELMKVQEYLRKEEKQREAVKKSAREAKEKLAHITLVVKQKADEKGRLFGSLQSDVIATSLGQHKIFISPKQVVIEEPIKELGEREVMVDLGHGEKGIVKVKIEAE